MSLNYDAAIWFYDPLSRMVFGGSLIRAQTYLLSYIKINSNILIIGGGTGWILEEITKLFPSSLDITYVEMSPKMMARSKKRYTGDNQISFITQPIEQVKDLAQFDFVITAFLFDNFSQTISNKVFDKIHHLLKPGGLWLYTDFQKNNKIWQKILLSSMLGFFKLVCGIEARELPEVLETFESYKYSEIASQFYYKQFVIATVSQKPY